MSKVKIKGNASGTGVLTIEAPNTDTDSTITLPDGTGELIQADASGNVGIGTDNPAQKLSLVSGYVQVGNGISGAGGVKYPYSSANADCRNWRTRSDIVEYGDWGLEQSTTQSGETYSNKFRVSQAGYVTMPSQPAFFAVKSGHLMEVSGTTVLTGWSINVNVGSHFNSSNGRFTAPVAGRYVFLQSMMSGATSGDVQFRIVKNGGVWAGSNNMNAGAQWRQTTVTAVVNLSVGDYVTFDAYSSVSSSNHLVYQSTYSHVSGYLIG